MKIIDLMTFLKESGLSFEEACDVNVYVDGLTDIKVELLKDDNTLKLYNGEQGDLQ